jgi:hypothetical protein
MILPPCGHSRKTSDTLQALNDDQQDGIACVECGRSDREMIVVPDVIGRDGSQLFCCDCCEPSAEMLICRGAVKLR